MSDVSAIVLSLGEPSLQRALESLRAQTHPLHEVILVEHVAPFFRAFNEGARRVTTPFFVQVDADMTLDATCVAELRAAMHADVGLAYGELRDPLMGQVVGVKLFRTECVHRRAFADSISPDTDFNHALVRAGWRVTYVGLPAPGSDTAPRSFGEHRPDYTPEYTFAKYLLEGRRYRYRGQRDALSWHLERLDASPHPLARLAQVALAHGFFLESERDELKPRGDDSRAQWLATLLGSSGTHPAGAEALAALGEGARLRDIFRRFLRAGRALAEADAGHSARDVLDALARRGRDSPTLVARLALGHGLLAGALDERGAQRAEHMLEVFVRLGVGRRLGAWDHVRSRAVALARRLRPGAERLWW